MKNANACNRQRMDQIASNYAQFDQLKEQQTAEEIELARISREEEKERDDLDTSGRRYRIWRLLTDMQGRTMTLGTNMRMALSA